MENIFLFNSLAVLSITFLKKLIAKQTKRSKTHSGPPFEEVGRQEFQKFFLLYLALVVSTPFIFAY